MNLDGSKYITFKLNTLFHNQRNNLFIFKPDLQFIFGSAV